MFDQLTDKLARAFKHITGQSRFTEENMRTPLQEIRLSLLEADVALPVVKAFIEQVKTKAIGQDVDHNLKSNQALVKIVKDELIHLLGDKREEFNFNTQPPAVCLIAGLQGSGKTTNAAKLAQYLQETEKKKVMLVSVDIYRPAAIEQLRILADSIQASFVPSQSTDKPTDIVSRALEQAKNNLWMF